MRAVVAPDRALAMRKLADSFEIGAARPLKRFQRMLGLMAAASPAVQLGLLRMRPLQCLLKPRVPSHAWRHGCLRIRVSQACVNSLSPLEEPSLDGKGHGHGNGLQEKGCHDRCLQHRLGGAVQRQTNFRPLVESGERLPHLLLGNASSMLNLPVLPARPNRTPCA